MIDEKKARNAMAALYLLEAAASLLEQLPSIDARLRRFEASMCKRLRAERNRMLDIAEPERAAKGAGR